MRGQRCSSPWDVEWKQGDTLGVAADFDANELLFGCNGEWSVAFEGLTLAQGLYPAVSGSRMAFSVNSPPRFEGPTAAYHNLVPTGKQPSLLPGQEDAIFLVA